MKNCLCCHDFKVGGVEGDRLDVEVVDKLEVKEMSAADGLGIIKWREEGKGSWKAMLENTDFLSEGLSFTDHH